jgi:F-box protein 21
MNSISLIDLPDEVIQNVLFHLNYTNALALEATCRRFRAVANEPLLWKSFCRDSWKKWQPRHNFKAKIADSKFHGWKGLFAERTRSHREVCALVKSIVEEDGNRIAKVERIVDLGWDAKDTLLDGFQRAHLFKECVLAQRWDRVAILLRAPLTTPRQVLDSGSARLLTPSNGP